MRALRLAPSPRHHHNAAIAEVADRVIRMADGLIAREWTNARRASPQAIAW